MKQNITINDLINILSNLPEDAKELPIANICGCVDCFTSDDDEMKPGFQFELDTYEIGHKKYVIAPKYKEDVMYDSFGKRKLNK